jgi:very-short-patch-repair endonuclease
VATNARQETVSNARQLRKQLTPPEARLWVALRRRGLGGLKFRRQHPLGAYVLDFYCPSARLAVEVDGMQHVTEEQAAHDRGRDRWLHEQGVRVLRIPAHAVRDELERVLDVIDRAAGSLGDRRLRPPSALRATSPSRGKREMQQAGDPG